MTLNAILITWGLILAIRPQVTTIFFKGKFYMFEKATNSLKKGVYAVSSVANTLGVSIMVMVVLLVVADVFSRRAFNSPIMGVLELTKVALVLIVFLTLAYCGIRGGHVEVESVVTRFPKRIQVATTALMYFLSTAMLGVASWQLLAQGMDMQTAGQTSGLLKIALFPFLYVAALGTALLALVYLVRFFQTVQEARG